MVIDNKVLSTAESVTEGHPDKIADQISDAILDAALVGDPNSRVACETLVTTGLVVIAGEITTDCYIHIDQVARDTIREIGYDHGSKGFDCNTCAIVVTVGQQSQDIADGVNIGGAGDQGLMFGYATTETPELMPAPIYFANALTRKLAEVRKSGQIEWLRPDGKSQVTVEFSADRIARIHTVVISAQHAETTKNREIRERIISEVIKPALPSCFLDANTIYHINPTGRFVTGGPMGDTGLTGRKIIVDTYGGSSHHGGGAFSGKDPSKVDRSGAYMCRYIAKNIVAAGIARRCEIQLAYAIGIAEPLAIGIDTFNTSLVDNSKIIKAVRNIFDCTPKGIIESLNLRQPIYRSTSAYGHFGRSEFSWERTDKTQELINETM